MIIDLSEKKKKQINMSKYHVLYLLLTLYYTPIAPVYFVYAGYVE